MPRGLLFVGGRGPYPSQVSQIVKPDDVICAADSGLDAVVAAGLQALAVVGDMDSISSRKLLKPYTKSQLEIHPTDKNDSDTVLGIRWLRQYGCRSLMVIGGGEGRLDHTLALVKNYDGQDFCDLWITAMEAVFFLTERSGHFQIEGKPDQTISIVAAGKGPWKLVTSGLKWPLHHLDWAATGMSLSNRLTSNGAVFHAKQGRFLLIRPLADVIGQF